MKKSRNRKIRKCKNDVTSHITKRKKTKIKKMKKNVTISKLCSLKPYTAPRLELFM